LPPSSQACKKKTQENKKKSRNVLPFLLSSDCGRSPALLAFFRTFLLSLLSKTKKKKNEMFMIAFNCSQISLKALGIC